MHRRNIARAQRHRRMVSRCTTGFAQECANFFLRRRHARRRQRLGKAKNFRLSPALIDDSSHPGMRRGAVSEVGLQPTSGRRRCLRELVESAPGLVWAGTRATHRRVAATPRPRDIPATISCSARSWIVFGQRERPLEHDFGEVRTIAGQRFDAWAVCEQSLRPRPRLLR